MYSLIEQNLKDIDMINFESKEKNTYKNTLLEINKLIIGLITINNIPYNYQYLNSRTKTLKVYNGNLLEADDENNIIQICQHNQLGEKLTDEDEVINLIHEYLHIVSVRNYKDKNDISNFYYGFDEFCTEFITFLICMKIGINYETYYRKHLNGYIDKNDNHFMKKVSTAIGLNVLLEIYFTGNRNLLEQTLGIELLLNMNEYLDYYLEIYDALKQPKKVVNEILKKPVFETQRQRLNNFVDRINASIDSIFDRKEHPSGSIKK